MGLGRGWHGHGVGRIDYEGPRRLPAVARQDLRRILGYFRPYWPTWVLILVCIAAAGLLGLLPPLLIKTIIDRAIPERDGLLLNLLALGMVLVPSIAGLVGVGQNYLNTRVGQAVMFDLRNDLYRNLQRQSLRFFTTARTGELMSRLTNDVADVQETITGTVVSIVTNGFVVVSTTLLIFSMNWRLALLSLAVLPLFILPTRRVGRIRQRLRRETAEKRGALGAFMAETLSVSGALLVKAFSRESGEADRFRQRSRELMELDIRRNMVGRWFFMFLGLFGAVGPALIYWYGSWQVFANELTIGTIVAFTAYLNRLYGPVSQLANVHVDIMSALALFERLFAYLDLEPDVQDPPDAIARRLSGVRGHLRFDQVDFEYVAGRAALSQVSFEAAPGQLVALVGPSGAGKTTITYLVPRLYDPTSGTVQLDGHDLRTLRLAFLRSQIGMVTQETYLFHATVRENLLYGRPEASQQELDAACQAAYLAEVIEALPEGYETMVGERGYRLSGGEKQRLAIARVLLKNPRVLLLDEATSSLDSRSEAYIQAALAPLLSGRTSLVIAHRLSTILAADQILVLDRGGLVERGTHADLLAHGGLYARLYEEQFKGTAATASLSPRPPVFPSSSPYCTPRGSSSTA
jgi:ATP-binding cassette, subfamily B, bacterial